MRRITYLFAFIVLFSNCENKKHVPKNINIVTEKEQINTVLEVWHKNAADANFEGYFGGMTNNGVFIGTDASENWTNVEFKDFSKPYFDKGKAWSFTAIERNLYVYKDGEMAWFDELLDTHMGICRGSGVLK